MHARQSSLTTQGIFSRDIGSWISYSALSGLCMTYSILLLLPLLNDETGRIPAIFRNRNEAVTGHRNICLHHIRPSGQFSRIRDQESKILLVCPSLRWSDKQQILISVGVCFNREPNTKLVCELSLELSPDFRAERALRGPCRTSSFSNSVCQGYLRRILTYDRTIELSDRLVFSKLAAGSGLFFPPSSNGALALWAWHQGNNQMVSNSQVIRVIKSSSRSTWEVIGSEMAPM